MRTDIELLPDMTHRNIVTLLEWYVEPPLSILVFELASDGDVVSRVLQNGPYLRGANRVLSCFCRGENHASRPWDVMDVF